MSRAARGYLLVAGSFLIMGLIGALVEWATAPESALLVLRFATAGLVLGVVFARRRPLAGAAQRSVWPRLLLMAAVDALHAPALLRRHPRDERRHRHVPAVPGARVGGAHRAARVPRPDRGDRVPCARDRPRRARRDPDAVTARRGHQALAVGRDGGPARRRRLRRLPARGQGSHQAHLGGDHRLHRGLARRAHPAAARALADGRRRLPADNARPGRRPHPRGGLHGARVPDVDLRHGHDQGAAQLDPRLPRAGVGAHLRAAPARPGHLGLDHRRRRPHRGRRPAGGAARRARGGGRRVLEPAP